MDKATNGTWGITQYTVKLTASRLQDHDHRRLLKLQKAGEGSWKTKGPRRGSWFQERLAHQGEAWLKNPSIFQESARFFTSLSMKLEVNLRGQGVHPLQDALVSLRALRQ